MMSTTSSLSSISTSTSTSTSSSTTTSSRYNNSQKRRKKTRSSNNANLPLTAICGLFMGMVCSVLSVTYSSSFLFFIFRIEESKGWTGSSQVEVELEPPPFFPIPDGVPLKAKSYNPRWLLVGETRKFAMTMIPKVMTSAIRGGFNKPNCQQNPNVTTKLCAEARKNKRLGTHPLTNYTTAIMIRDPFERAYSAYTNSPYNRMIYLDVCKNRKRFQCTFAEWVDELARGGVGNGAATNSSNSNSTSMADVDTNIIVVVEESRNKLMSGNEHFKSQHSIAQMDRMHYHYRLRMTSERDRRYFWKHLVQFQEIVTNVEGDGGQGKVRMKSDEERPPLVDIEAIRIAKARKVEERFLSIPNRTIDQLATLYSKDLVLWQRFLDEGTPRMPGDEVTMYDFYLERKRRQLLEEGR